MNIPPLSKRVFHRYDADGSNSIDKFEFQQMALSMGHFMTQTQTDLTFRSIDTSGDGQISYDEFLVWWRQSDRFDQFEKMSPEDEDILKNCVDFFLYFDKDRSGVLSREEFRNLHNTLIERKFYNLTFDKAFAELDQDNSGTVEFNEYISWLVKIGSIRLHSA
ncbi:hypothetical protein H696_01876 [Fonticula alba]|uniref:EF-hand domain-containing protein n=1 Tax=Fonticula alba TaxID=691883 RepID=A0A058Z9I2_FONAL|nr:hypothetical protein H696_01876 [Fonticula alba]KCV70930.1 hypothetical protein H696_01876 [Fonticula alba]|eukprot:XP_009494053.1 hypothetical protein H696_01876 [Fonticula alba]